MFAGGPAMTRPTVPASAAWMAASTATADSSPSTVTASAAAPRAAAMAVS
jgi:hypothetical protein